ncbi:hypothetical protein EBB59_06490 [Lysobacter pythonis]|uniref:NERD domain-containing protein n=1 Tax=Solilutibacter pythonis TaxID=2483112 RepID=A0A3M2HZW0_9GAMM|nr:hypothetical protein [Lysobacter pythonis]RMH93180.1 hypothetical protein EBB59_06490 [Lysobacter pythonis]
MDAFEQLVAGLLERRGWWVRAGYKVALTRDEKIAIGRHSAPRWEIDLLAYRGAENRLLAVECKSYLDSRGVTRRGFDGSDPKRAGRYKLFNDAPLRQIVLNRLRLQLTAAGAVAENAQPQLALAAARIASAADRDWLRAHFAAQGWRLFDDESIRADLRTVAGDGYENQVAAIAAKILLR